MKIANHKSKIINALQAIFAMLLAVFSSPEYCCSGAVEVQVNGDIPIEELRVIFRAAERNKCRGDDFLLLLAIRKAENGRPSREFGILHPRCLKQIAERPEDSLDIQAGWAAATIGKNRCRWESAIDEHRLTQIQNKSTVQSVKSVAKSNDEFIDFLGDRYCPASVDPQGNENWKRNVRYFFDKFKRE